ncbi:MAG: hypothetical protein AAF829_00860 [Pseudomonadota bacterium]
MKPDNSSSAGVSKRSKSKAGSASVFELVDKWYACKNQITQIEVQQDELFFSEKANTELFYQLDNQRDSLKSSSVKLLDLIRKTPAGSLDEVMAKLALWRDIRFPDGSTPTQKNAMDLVTVSALEDLERLARKR